jgi:hypothetical protein
MLRGNSQAASPDLQRLVDQILDEETRSMICERRDASRQSITRPLLIEPRDDSRRTVDAFSRDLSSQGVGVISRDAFKQGTMARILISRVNGPPSVVLAECRWCDRYENGWFLSGWTFVAVHRT